MGARYCFFFFPLVPSCFSLSLFRSFGLSVFPSFRLSVFRSSGLFVFFVFFVFLSFCIFVFFCLLSLVSVLPSVPPALSASLCLPATSLLQTRVPCFFRTVQPIFNGYGRLDVQYVLYGICRNVSSRWASRTKALCALGARSRSGRAQHPQVSSASGQQRLITARRCRPLATADQPYLGST